MWTVFLGMFSKYGKGQVILHDSDRPERIYSILSTGARCSRRREPAVIKRERKKIAAAVREFNSEANRDR